MARLDLDQNGNEEFSTLIGKLSSMFTELYTSFAGATDPAINSLTVATTAAVSGALTAASAVLSGLATSASLKLDTGTKTASATAGAATLNKSSGVITSEALTTADQALYTLTLTNSAIAAADIVGASVQLGTATHGTPIIVDVTPAAGSVVIRVKNDDGVNAVNGTIKVAFWVLKA